MPRVLTNGIETSYEIHGSGLPVVLIHGAWSSRRMWEDQVPELARRYRVLVYDLRGHGLTGPTSREAYPISLFADDLDALLEHLSLERVVLCGLSFGGFIALDAALRYPERVGALILVGMGASVGLTLSDRLQRALYFLPERAVAGVLGVLGLKRMLDLTFWLAERTALKRWLGLYPGSRRKLRESVAIAGAREFLKVLRSAHRYRIARSASTSVPALLLGGEAEPGGRWRRTDLLWACLPNAREVRLRGAGHVANLDDPEAFNRALEAFLEESGVVGTAPQGGPAASETLLEGPSDAGQEDEGGSDEQAVDRGGGREA